MHNKIQKITAYIIISALFCLPLRDAIAHGELNLSCEFDATTNTRVFQASFGDQKWCFSEADIVSGQKIKLGECGFATFSTKDKKHTLVFDNINDCKINFSNTLSDFSVLNFINRSENNVSFGKIQTHSNLDFYGNFVIEHLVAKAQNVLCRLGLETSLECQKIEGASFGVIDSEYDITYIQDSPNESTIQDITCRNFHAKLGSNVKIEENVKGKIKAQQLSFKQQMTKERQRELVQHLQDSHEFESLVMNEETIKLAKKEPNPECEEGADENVVTINSLPNDIILYILSYFSFKELGTMQALGTTARRYNKIINVKRLPALLKKHSEIHNNIQLGLNLHLYLCRIPSLANFIVDEIWHNKLVILDGRVSVPDNIVQNLTKLKELHILWHCNIKDSDLRLLTNLEKLYLGKVAENITVTENSLTELRNLKEFVLEWNNNKVGGKCIKKLTNLISLSFMPSDIIQGIHIQNLTNLKALNLSGYYNTIPGETLKHLTKLEKLHLDFNSKITDQHISHLTNLTEINLKQNSTITDNVLQHFTNLTALNLEWNRTITDMPLKCLTKLKVLNLHHNTIITDDSVQWLTNLMILNLGYSHITDSCLTKLTKLIKLRVAEGTSFDAVSRLTSLQALCYHIRSDVISNSLRFIDSLPREQQDTARNLYELPNYNDEKTWSW